MNRFTLGRAAPLAVAALLGATLLPAQTPAPRTRAPRDSARVLGRLTGDRDVLIVRLDSLQRMFELEPLDDGQRARLSRQLNQLVGELGRLMAEDAQNEATRQLRQLRYQQLESGAAAAALARDMAKAWQMEQPLSGAVSTRGWIGLNVEAPHAQTISKGGEVLVRYFDYPSVVSVEPNSPAERAGAHTGEVLIAFDGRDVRQNDINVSRLLRPSRRIEVTLRTPTSDGEVTRVLPMTVAPSPNHVIVRRNDLAKLPPEAMPVPMLAPMAPRAEPMPMSEPDVPDVPPTPRARWSQPAMPAMAPRAMVFGLDEPNAFGGARLETLNPDLGRSFGLRSGVLVIDAPGGSPARTSGLRGGDVIVRAGGRSVTSVSQLRRLIDRSSDDRRLALEVVRAKRTRKVVLEW